MHATLVDVLRHGSLVPMFADFVCPAAYSALLTLSRDAGALLRHARTCCLRSVADVLDVRPHRLLVMVDTRPPPPTTYS